MKNKIFSLPLFKQTLKANWVIWLVLTLGSAAIFFIVNVVVCSHDIFTNINMDSVTQYVEQEDLSWLVILGLMEKMGFSLSRIQTMSQIDINSIISDLFYKIAGTMLPMIYVMVVSNALLARQVNDGSMAYVLSTPTSRKTVVRTQFAYLLVSLIAMYLVIGIAALGSESIAGIIRLAANPDAKNMIPLKTILFCLASFCAMFALMGICFGASAFFNKSSNSLALGGGVCVFCFLSCVLGLFGTPVFVSVGIGVSAMNIFNYMTLFTLIDTDAMTAFSKYVFYNGQDGAMTLQWIWEIAILVGVGGIFSFLGGCHFVRKDLPL